MAIEPIPATDDRYAAFDAAINAHRSEADKQEAIERGELPRTQAPKAPRILRWIDVPDYDGFQYRAHLNFPQRLFLDIQSGDQERARSALQRIVVDHNGWCDDEGEPYPEAADPRFWDAIPTHLGIRVVQSLQEVIRTAPLAPQRKGS